MVCLSYTRLYRGLDGVARVGKGRDDAGIDILFRMFFEQCGIVAYDSLRCFGIVRTHARHLPRFTGVRPLAWGNATTCKHKATGTLYSEVLHRRCVTRNTDCTFVNTASWWRRILWDMDGILRRSTERLFVRLTGSVQPQSKKPSLVTFR